MRKLKIFEHVSLDGVVQHTADENNFSYAGWTVPFRSPEGLAKLSMLYGETYDILLGRRTYDILSTFGHLRPAVPSPTALMPEGSLSLPITLRGSHGNHTKLSGRILSTVFAALSPRRVLTSSSWEAPHSSVRCLKPDLSTNSSCPSFLW